MDAVEGEEMIQKFIDVCTLLALGFLLYAAIACTIYRFKHPEYTETQRFLKMKDALLLRD